MPDSRKMRIAFMGTPEFAVSSLRALVDGGYDVVAVVTAPDKPAGRGLQMHESAVKQYALSAGLQVLQPVKLRDEQFVRQFEALNLDLAIIIAFRMLPEVIWNAPRYGTFNLHASLLPQYRGAAPINWAVINGDKKTGLTTFMLNAEIDEGAILGRLGVDIAADDTAGSLHDRLMLLGPGLVLETVEAIASGHALAEEQRVDDGILPKLAPKIFKQDCLIDWNMPGKRICDLVRGLSPYPAAWSVLRRDNAEPMDVKIFAVMFKPADHELENGRIISDGKSHIYVACRDGYIEIKELQAAGKKRMEAEEFLRGFRDVNEYYF